MLLCISFRNSVYTCMGPFLMTYKIFVVVPCEWTYSFKAVYTKNGDGNDDNDRFLRHQLGFVRGFYNVKT